MSLGSYLRFFVGLLLALSVIWAQLSGDRSGMLPVGLAVIFVILALIWMIFKI